MDAMLHFSFNTQIEDEQFHIVDYAKDERRAHLTLCLLPPDWTMAEVQPGLCTSATPGR